MSADFIIRLVGWLIAILKYFGALSSAPSQI